MKLFNSLKCYIQFNRNSCFYEFDGFASKNFSKLFKKIIYEERNKIEVY